MEHRNPRPLDGQPPDRQVEWRLRYRKRHLDSSVGGTHLDPQSIFRASNFRIRLTGRENCTNNLQFRVDMVDIRVKWQHDHTSVVTEDVPDQPLKGPGRACDNSKAACFEADGEDLEERGFWATLNTQGSENVNGDAYQPYYDTRTNGVSPVCPQRDRACYDPTTFYNYIIEMPPGATNGKVYVYDPQFCAVVENKGTGDRWFGGGNPISTYYALYDTKTSLLDFVEDQPALVSSGSTFRLMDFTDTDMDGSGGGLECTYRNDMLYGDGRDWHNRWYLLNPLSEDQMVGGDDGKLYRIHTTSTNLSNASEQSNANGENSFAIYVSAENTGGVTPRVYGLGAMQAFTPLTSNSSIDNNWADDVLSEFYLAQIEAADAGKTMEISLWDPGDTQSLRAELQILRPDAAGARQAGPRQRSPTRQTRGPAMAYRANCNSLSNSATTSVLTNNGGGSGSGSSTAAGSRIRTPIPDDYDADQGGWWKIRYRMDGNGTSFDVTTWKVNLIGNPVHLVE